MVALVCNIDQRGRTVRYRIGFVLVALAVLVYACATPLVEGPLPLYVAVPLLVAGLFALFEAHRGWCAARALGFKTKI